MTAEEFLSHQQEAIVTLRQFQNEAYRHTVENLERHVKIARFGNPDEIFATHTRLAEFAAKNGVASMAIGCWPPLAQLLLLTATPHNGKDEDFQLFLSLLDGDRFEGKFRDGVHVQDVSDLMRRMVKENLVTMEGKPLFPERFAYTLPFPLTSEELALYAKVTPLSPFDRPSDSANLIHRANSAARDVFDQTGQEAVRFRISDAWLFLQLILGGVGVVVKVTEVPKGRHLVIGIPA